MQRQHPEAGSRDAERTRRALLAAASAEFSQHGYTATTARRIAARAGVNQALVFRYFGSKRNLYELSLQETDTVDPAGNSAEDVALRGKAMLLAVLRRFVHSTSSAEQVDVHPVLAMLRSVSTPTGAAAMREQMRSTYLPAVETFIAHTHPDWPAERCAVRAELAWAWILGIGVVRTVVGLPAVSDMAPEDLEALVDDVFTRLAADDSW